jgi:Tfp pilus assembly protein PilZ
MTRRLHLQFDRADEFHREFDRNIAKGGVFVPGAGDLLLRQVVEVELELTFCAQTSRLEAEVVHVVPSDSAPTPAAAGAAVQFLRSAPEVRDEFAAALAVPVPEPETGGDADQWQLDDLEDESGIDLDDLGDLASLEDDESEGDDLSLQDQGPLLDLAGEGEDLGGDLFGAAKDFSETAPEAPPLELPVEPLEAPQQAIPVEEPPEPERAPEPPSGFERRRAPRSPARVPASLDGPNARIEGVTRDLSETGALISADASEFPVGKEVRLSLQHPDDGERFEVGGRVVRHVETEGTVAAVSVLFDVAAEQKDELAALVHAAQSAHQERAASGISGRIEELGMPSLIQMLGRSSPLGTLAVRSGSEEGVLAFDGGALRYVRLGATRGLKALSRMLGWREGSFEFHAHVAALDDEDEPMRLEAALLQVTRHADEAARAPGVRFDGAQRFRIDRAALAATEALDKIEEAVLDLAAAGFTVRRIHDVIPEADAQVAAALLALVERGVLEAT